MTCFSFDMGIRRRLGISEAPDFTWAIFLLSFVKRLCFSIATDVGR